MVNLLAASADRCQNGQVLKICESLRRLPWSPATTPQIGQPHLLGEEAESVQCVICTDVRGHYRHARSCARTVVVGQVDGTLGEVIEGPLDSTIVVHKRGT